MISVDDLWMITVRSVDHHAEWATTVYLGSTPIPVIHPDHLVSSQGDRGDWKSTHVPFSKRESVIATRRAALEPKRASGRRVGVERMSSLIAINPSHTPVLHHRVSTTSQHTIPIPHNTRSSHRVASLAVGNIQVASVKTVIVSR
jgi:hypothetical protein